MAAPSYTTDLATIVLCEAGDVFEEFTGYTLGDNAAVETDWYLHGAACASDEANGKTGVGHSIGYDYGNDLAGSFSAGDCVFAWMVCLNPNFPDTFANGGYRMLIGATTTNFNGWRVGGSDYGRNPYGGWTNVVVDPTYTADYTGGTGHGGVYQHFAVAFVLTTSTLKGRPLCMDAMRYGRGELIVEYGEAANYATFAGIATANDGTNARWGLFQAQSGGYLWKGLISLGNATNAVDFRDSNRAISIDDCQRTYATFNKIEVSNAGSRVDWTNISFTSIGTAAPGVFEMVNNADVNIDSCSFVGMGAFTFQLNGAATNSSWTNCGLITGAGGVFTGSKVLLSSVAADASAFNWNVATDPDGYLDNMTFSKGTNAHHAIEFGTSSPLTMTVRGWTTSGFNASNGQNDSTFYVARTTGTVTINVIGGTGNFSYKSAGATVVISVDPAILTVTVQDKDTNPIENVQTAIYKISDRTEFMNKDTNASGVATEPYTGATPVDVEIRCRKASAGATKYKNYSTLGTITGNFDLLVTLDVDPNNNAAS